MRGPLALRFPELRPTDLDFSERLPLKAEVDLLPVFPPPFARADFKGRAPTLFELGSSPNATLAFLERLLVGGVSFSSLSKSNSSFLPNLIDL